MVSLIGGDALLYAVAETDIAYIRKLLMEHNFYSTFLHYVSAFMCNYAATFAAKELLSQQRCSLISVPNKPTKSFPDPSFAVNSCDVSNFPTVTTPILTTGEVSSRLMANWIPG